MSDRWYQFRFTEPADVPEPKPVNLMQVIEQANRNADKPPIDLPSHRAMRRDRVSTSVCKQGRVCSGTPPCPCWDGGDAETLDEWERRGRR